MSTFGVGDGSGSGGDQNNKGKRRTREESRSVVVEKMLRKEKTDRLLVKFDPLTGKSMGKIGKSFNNMIHQIVREMFSSRITHWEDVPRTDIEVVYDRLDIFFNTCKVKLYVKRSSLEWRHDSMKYQVFCLAGHSLLLDFIFGLNMDHLRKQIKIQRGQHIVNSVEMIVLIYSDKFNHMTFINSTFYSFETWATQINNFCIDVVKGEAFLICNSIGGLVGLQAAVMKPEICKGILLLNISLRMLHIKKQPWYGRPLIRSFQNLLRNTDLGKFFFKAVATPESVRNILCQCYHDSSQVTDELVEAILLPGLEPGAADVFLEFICYSDGPLPEELLPQVKCPVLVGWGDKDPWEPIELGRAYADFDSVESFVVLPNVGHCPQDEAPHLVNPLIESFVARHSTPQATLSANKS
ncbi:hypothetical protein LguiB_001762 [Lonicera macranthoides]